ncbi:MAG: competence/damage-inducible protein A [Bacteroidia bacterium]
MLTEIITIGDEILIGQIVDTNSAWMGQQLNRTGIKVKQISSVSDDPQHIVQALDLAKTRADLILITGGLGPTKDDLTKKTLKDYFGMAWRTDDEVLEDVKKRFAAFGRVPTEINLLQAQVPDGCRVIRNLNGTAPGMWFEQDGKVFVSMPGVPFEMMSMMEQGVLPLLRERFKLPFIYHKTILTQGVGESMLAEKIEAWEASLEALGIKLAYLPSVGMVRLRLSSSGHDEHVVKNNVHQKVAEVLPLIGTHVFGYDEDTLEQVLGNLLLKQQATVSTAESCTGGYLAHRITSVAGSSAYFMGSIISYANDIKTAQLNVPADLIARHGAVSEEVVSVMAKNCREKMQTMYSIAISGVAGPSGGSDEKPVGTIYMAVASAQGIRTHKVQYGGNRERNIQYAASSALFLLRKVMLNLE